MAYLGVIPLLLMAFAAAARSRFRHAEYLWATFAMLVVLSLGSYWGIEARLVSLPSSWLYDIFPPFRLTRVPSLFCMFAAVIAGVLAAAGLMDAMARLPVGPWRPRVFALITVLAVADLTKLGVSRAPAEPMPGGYAFLMHRDPKAKLMEIPYQEGGFDLNGECTYWQSLHRLTTSAGYSGHSNARQVVLIGHNSPFRADRMASPDYLDNPASFPVELTADVDFKDYVWLYLTANRFDYLVVHRSRLKSQPLKRLRAILDDSLIFEDSSMLIYARAQMPKPSKPVQLTREGWDPRNGFDGRWNSILPETARVVIYNPDADVDLSLHLDAATLRRPKTLMLRAGEYELARWDLDTYTFQTISSPPFRLPVGLHELTLASELNPVDAGEKARAAREARMAQKLRVASVKILARPVTSEVARKVPETSTR